MTSGDSAFVDTNIFVYAFTNDHPEKHKQAASLLRDLMVHQTLRTSTQVMQELYVILTRKFSEVLSSAEAVQRVRAISRWRIVSLTPEMVLAAAEVSTSNRISFWDSLIVVAAQHAGARFLFTEDLSHGQKILGVEVVNPFLASA